MWYYLPALHAITPPPRRDPEGALGSTAHRWVSAVVNSVVQPGSWLVHIAAHDMSHSEVLMHHPEICCSHLFCCSVVFSDVVSLASLFPSAQLLHSL